MEMQLLFAMVRFYHDKQDPTRRDEESESS
jgi:hypothetical protein